LKDEAHVVRGSPPWFVEVLNPNVCKGNGLKQMSKHLDIPPEEIIAFGDGDNDLEFLDYAGKGIAMKNARDNVKAAANEITEWTNAEVRFFLCALYGEKNLNIYALAHVCTNCLNLI